MLRQGAVAAVAGLVTGLVASAGAARAMRAIFPNEASSSDPNGPVAFALVGAAVLVVTMIAAYLPARRAARINPTEALRHE